MESTNPKDAFGKLKPSLTSIPPAASIHMALAMMNGAEKYGPYNWRAKTVAARVYLDAASRHIISWLDGEENAADSGIHHLGHALASLGIILDAQANGTLVDDRPLPGGAARLLEQFTKRTGPAAGGNGTERTATEECRACSIAGGADCAVRHEPPMCGNPDNRPTEADARELGWSPQDQHLLIGGDHHLFDVTLDGNGRVTEMREVVGVTGQDGTLNGVMYLPRKRHLPRVYIAGPMRGYPKFNFPAFDVARDLAIAEGFSPISPADMDRENDIHEDSAVVLDAAGIRVFVDRDTKALQSLRAEDGDAIALLPGWEKSTGAVAEFFLARWLGLTVLDARTMEPFLMGCEGGRNILRAAQLQALVKSAWKYLFPGSKS